jgi:hypothetical protein
MRLPSTLLRLRNLRLALASALLSGLVFAGAAPPAAHAGVALGKPQAYAEEGVISAGSPATFKASVKFSPPAKGHGENEDPWVSFKWNFGDGTPVQGGGYFSSGKGTDSVQHTFANPGTYTVICVAGHGATFFGYKYSATKSIKVTVACAGTDPGTVCRTGTWDAFTGTWTIENPGQMPADTVVTLTEAGKKVTGTISFTSAPRGKLIQLPVKGTPKFKATVSDGGQRLETLVLNGKAKADGVMWDYGIALDVSPFHGLSNTGTGLVAYRHIVVGVADLSEVDENGKPLPVLHSVGRCGLAARSTGVEATVCCGISSSVRFPNKAKPLQTVTFIVDITNTGLACLPAERIGVDVQLQGATMSEDAIQLERFFAHATTATNFVGVLGPLGDGQGQRNGHALLVIRAKVDASANEVECLVHLTDLSPVDDREFAALTLPPDRKVCLVVDQGD